MKRTQKWFEERIRPKLKELGSTPNKIAASLAKKKIKGVPGDSDDCALAKWVQKLFPKADGIAVDGNEISVTYDGEEFSINTSKAFGEFISKFDNDEYPDITDPEHLKKTEPVAEAAAPTKAKKKHAAVSAQKTAKAKAKKTKAKKK